MSSVGSVSGPLRNYNLNNTAMSAIRSSGKKAGFTGRKLAIWTALIAATLGAMFAPSLAVGVKDQGMKLARNFKRVDNKYALVNMKLNIDQRQAVLDLKELAMQVNNRANSLARKELNRSYEREKFTKNMASKAAATNAWRNVTYMPAKTAATITGISTNVLNILGKTAKNTKRTVGAVTETVAKTTENVQETAGILTEGMVSTSKFLGPFAFVATMVILATTGASMVGISIPARVITSITKLLTSMITKGVPMTKNVVVDIFNKLYSYVKPPPDANSDRFENVTNNRN